ncbi:hypothetical protein [uncultured Clostridium sp.]|uniref:hypothetical protein n=1 Tax=uncultured Clostridium sp. TaxID=59620 RepID=UPI0026039ABE|nr:hypothetical protein [uncultured Clostridium sp.]
MIKIINENIKGPSIDWDNYLTQEELYALDWKLMTFEGIINRLLDSGRLEQSKNKSFNDLVDELTNWWNNTHNNTDFLEEDKGDKVNKFYYEIRNHIKKNLELNNRNYTKLPNEYWNQSDTKNLFKKLKQKIQSNIRLRDTDLNLGVIDKEKYDLDNKIDSILLDYCNDRLNSYNKKIEESLLHEKGRNDMLNKSKKESPGRWERRQYYKNFKVVKTDISELDDKDRVTVTFEVGDYIDTISFNNVLLNLRDVVKKDPKHMVKFDWVIRACNKAIDQSDVFVNCQCLDPDTKIKLLNGEIISIKEMKEKYDNNEELWVYSTDNKGDFKPGKVGKVWVSGTTDKLIEVELDNGEKIRTTNNHLYMLRDGSYLRADQLEEGMSLMPLYFINNPKFAKGYEQVKLNSIDNSYKSVYKIVAENYFNEKDYIEAKNRSNENEIVIHHKDYNKHNNFPSNFKLMGKKEHLRFHGTLIKELWKREEYREKQSKRAKEWMIKLNSNPTDKMIKARNSEENKKKLREYWNIPGNQEKLNKINSKAQKELWKNYTQEEKENRLKNHNMHKQENRDKVSKSNKKIWDNYTQEEKLIRKQKMINNLNGEDGLKVVKIKMKNTLERMIENNISLTLENYLSFKNKTTSRPEKCFKDFDEMLKYFNISTNYNHKIKSIKIIELNEPIEVYDLSVEKYHNFYVNAGIILHNCADFKYRFAYVASKGSYKYGKKEMRPADVRNPNDDKGSFCKHLLSVLSNKSWMTKVATTVNDWLQMKDVYEIRELLHYDEANMPSDISRDLGKMSADSKRSRANKKQNNIEEPIEETSDER